MGLLAKEEVVETSAQNLQAQYLGQTTAKVTEMLQKARGGVFFVDEAYDLGKGHYMQEAMNVLVQAMTDPDYSQTTIVFAGYPDDMDDMLNRNEGLKSRIDEYFDFPNWTTEDCVACVRQYAQKEKYDPIEGESTKLIQKILKLISRCLNAQLKKIE